MALSRYDDDFKALGNDTAKHFTLLPEIKTIFFDQDGDSFIGFGGEIREQVQIFNNEDWGSLPPGTFVGNSGKPYLLQRYLFHTDVQLTKYFRLFSELNSNFEHGRSTGPRPNIDQDRLDLHQAFADLNLFPSVNSAITLRAGRQELNYGASRLISVNEGPNNRLSFQGLKININLNGLKIDGFYVEPVSNNPGTFDDNANKQRKLFGIYAASLLPATSGSNIDTYVIGNDDNVASYFIGTAHEKRYSFGLRWYSKPGQAFHYDAESIYQAGTFGKDNINAYMAVAELTYTFQRSAVLPVIGLVGQIASGNRGINGQLNTFNPLYSRVYFGLGMPYWPSNLIQLTPTFEIKPFSKLTLDAAMHTLWRENNNDGLYLSGRLTRSPYQFKTTTISAKSFVGFQYDLNLGYSVTNYFSLEADFSAMPATNYIRETGTAKGIFFTNLQAKFRF